MTNRPDAFSEFDDFSEAGEPDNFLQDEGGQKPKEEMVPKSRLDEVLEQRDDARHVRDSIMKSALQPRLAPENTPDKADEGAEIDEEILATITPVLDRFRKELIQQFGPALSQAERRETLDVLNKRIKGFEKDLMQEVETVYRDLPPELQEEYGTRVGLESLAKDIQIRKLEEQVQGSQNAGRSALAASAPTGGAGGQPREITEADIARMSPDQFEKFKQHQMYSR